MRKPGMTVRLPLVLAAGFVLFAVAMSGVLVVIGRSTLTGTESAHLEARAATYKAAIAFYLENALDQLGMAAHLIVPGLKRQEAEAGQDGEIRSVLALAIDNSSAFEYLEVLRPDGTMVLIEPRELGQDLFRKSSSFMKWFQDALPATTPVVSDLFISRVTSRPTVHITVPIVGGDGRLEAMLAGSLKLQELSRAGSAGVETGSTRDFGYLTDSRGLVLAHQARLRYVIDQTDFSAEPTVREALAGNEGTMRFFDPLENEWMIGAHLPVRFTEGSSSRTWAIGFVIPQRIAYQPIVLLTSTIGVFAVASAIVLGSIGFLLIRRFLSPLDQLIMAARKAGSEDFSFRVEHSRDDEFATLAQAYNEMAARLGESGRKIRENDEQLRGMNGRLEEANRELEAFSYSVSHDLRAPLRAIDGFSHALVEDFGPRLDAEGLSYLERIRHGVQRMGDLIEDMLKLSGVNRSALTPEVVDLSALVLRQAEELASRGPATRPELIVAPAVTAMADRRLLQILIANLLENAWKFSAVRQPARIEFGQLEKGGTPVFFVRDNGVGFDMKYTGKLFSAFQRLHSASEYEGTGIGLAIVKRIAARHGGRVWAEAAVDEGAVFYFTLSAGEVS